MGQTTQTTQTTQTRLRDSNGRFMKLTDFGIGTTESGKRYHNMRSSDGRFTKRTVGITTSGKRYHSVRDNNGRFAVSN